MFGHCIMGSHIAVRCANNNPHGKYDTCGRLLCIIKDGAIILHCPVCREFIELKILNNENVQLKRLPKDTRFDLKTSLRLVKQ